MQPPADAMYDADSDDDPDYVPPANDPSDDEREHKRAKKDVVEAKTDVEDEATKQSKREALWTEFQASLSAPSPSGRSGEPNRMVKIEKRFRFAGEEVVETVDVPEDSEDAKKWPLWKSPSKEKPASDSTQPGELPSKGDAQPGVVLSTSPAGAVGKKPARRPGPRKPKTTLAPLPGAQKAKKLTTLDKSAMDWRSHVASVETSGLKDELDANRRGGGYLDKVEFLSRVAERKEEAFEANKSTKRRRT